ncbi:MAG: flagellar biosynthesis protein [Lachnospiraceae bacterium]|nr:flagellar biosynthesis protein [Lachnospiraceae bacterium]
MPERVQQLLQRFLEWWGGLTRRSKILIISAISVVVIAGGILAFVMTRPTMVTLVTAETAEQSQTIQNLLEGDGIAYKRSDDGMTYTINKKDEAAASILLGVNEIPANGYSIDDVLDGSFSTTEADKQKKYKVYLEEKFQKHLETLSNVNHAEVTLSIPDDDGTLIANEQDAYANVILELEDPSLMTLKMAQGIAKYIATGLGNDDTNNITILDNNGNTLFVGGEEATYEELASETASKNEQLRRSREKKIADEVKKVFSTNDGSRAMYDNVEVGINLVMNFDTTSSVDYHYYVDEGQTQGYLDLHEERASTTVNGVGGTPGTDSNDDETYVIEDTGSYTTSSSETIDDYLPSETITTKEGEIGVVNYETSSISVVAYNNVIYNEDQLKAAGQLEEMTFDEFVQQNKDQVVKEVPEEVFVAVANATGFPRANVSILSYDVPMFQYSEGSSRSITDIIQIVLAVLIFIMLGFVVFMSLRKQEEEAVAEEVTVEDLIEQQQKADEEAALEGESLEDISYSDKSEARIVIEKFVEEKPEAAAALLRNWLNEDWG